MNRAEVRVGPRWGTRTFSTAQEEPLPKGLLWRHFMGAAIPMVAFGSAENFDSSGSDTVAGSGIRIVDDFQILVFESIERKLDF